MSDNKPRTWTIGKAIYAYTDETTWDGPDLADDEKVEVVELEPVLDLLDTLDWDYLSEAVRQFMQAHGRGYA